MARKPATKAPEPVKVPVTAGLNGVAEVAPPTAAETAAKALISMNGGEKPDAPPVALVRAKASRPTFRRAGLVFNDRDWTVIDPEIGNPAALAILADPVLTVQVRGPDGWRVMTVGERAASASSKTGKA